MISLDQLKEINHTMQGIMAVRRIGEDMIRDAKAEGDASRIQILICGDTGCESSGSGKVLRALKEQITERNLDNEVTIIKTGCQGLCSMGPVMTVCPGGAFYTQIKEEDVSELIEEHIIGGKIVKRLLYHEMLSGDELKSIKNTGFFRKQFAIALRNCGVINPEDIKEYIGTGGYLALGKVLSEMSPDDVIQTLLDSGLRGRGGAGFPTGQKWKFAKANQADQKFVCCNADEGDPGAFMDRAVLEGDPHVVLESMAIAGYTIGSNQGYIYVRTEYPTAVKKLNHAIEEAHSLGLLGKNIMGTGFDFDIELRLGSGAFVCGEETALMRSIEGKRGEPRPRPPFPAVKGLFDKPTILNNVETMSNIPQIILNGPEWFSSIGTEKSKGTKVFALGGKITNTGLIEVPMGTTLRDIVEEIGGGVPNGKKFKAAQTGGPSGGCIPAEHADTPIDYDNLIALGSMMGSGGFIVMDEDTCMVDISKFFLQFMVDESCGKCTPCRVGTRRLYEMLDSITKGTATLEDLDKMEKLCMDIKANSLCGLGQTAPNPVISTLRYFRDEYIAHVVDKKCPAGICKNLISYTIDPDKCIGCTKCAKACPTDAIDGEIKKIHVINQEKCIKCGSCYDVCPVNAVRRG